MQIENFRQKHLLEHFWFLISLFGYIQPANKRLCGCVCTVWVVYIVGPVDSRVYQYIRVGFRFAMRSHPGPVWFQYRSDEAALDPV